MLKVFISLYTIQKSEPPKDKIDNKDESSQQQTQITDLPVTLPPTNNVMESQKQMLKFNQALQNNALQNLVNRDQNNEMNPPLDNNFIFPFSSSDSFLIELYPSIKFLDLVTLKLRFFGTPSKHNALKQIAISNA